MIKIDGSYGEGGGQILRTSLSLSLISGKALQIENIRAGRQRPGLLRQHLTAVLAAAEVGNAQIERAVLGSTSLTFKPGKVQGGEYRFSVGTAGSGTLVLQTILPALMLATEPSQVTIEGGTHNSMAPPYDFLARTFLPLLQRLGPKVDLKFERYGFYPAGAGRFIATITPVAKLQRLDLGARGEISSRKVIAVVANLVRKIAEREVATACDLLNWPPDCASIQMTRESTGPGNIVMVEIVSPEVTEIFSAFGEVGITAEKVAAAAVREAREYLVSQAASCEHLADQLLLPMALAGAGSFTAVKINLHAQTNMTVIAQFLPVRFEVTEDAAFCAVKVAS